TAYPDCSWQDTSNTCTAIQTCEDGSAAPGNNVNNCSCVQQGNCTCPNGSPAPGNNVNNCQQTCEPTTSCQAEGQSCGSLWDGCETISCGGSCVQNPGVSTSTISVSSNNSNATWTINPGNLLGSGTSGNYVVSPGQSGTTYTISPGALNGYDLSVSN